jgi:hypothetical protein
MNLKFSGLFGDEFRDAKENQIKVDFFPRARNKWGKYEKLPCVD